MGDDPGGAICIGAGNTPVDFPVVDGDNPGGAICIGAGNTPIDFPVVGGVVVLGAVYTFIPVSRFPEVPEFGCVVEGP